MCEWGREGSGGIVRYWLIGATSQDTDLTLVGNAGSFVPIVSERPSPEIPTLVQCRYGGDHPDKPIILHGQFVTTYKFNKKTTKPS